MAVLDSKQLVRAFAFCCCWAGGSLSPMLFADEAAPPASKPGVIHDAGVERTRAWLEKQRVKLRRAVDKELRRKPNDYFLIATLPRQDATAPRTDPKAKEKKEEKKPIVVMPQYTVLKGKAAAQEFVAGYQAEALLDVARILPEEEATRVLANRPWMLVGSFSTQAAGDAALQGRKAKDEKVLLAMQRVADGYGAPDEMVTIGVRANAAAIPSLGAPPTSSFVMTAEM